MQKKIASKGYTIKVVSWENDGDNYKTLHKVVEDRDEALKIKRICETLFRSCNNGDGGVGNAMDGECEHVIEEFIEANPEMGLTVGYIKDLAWVLMGGSEDYDFRVCESVTVTYLAEDVFAEPID
jgi:hypothetical protein